MRVSDTAETTRGTILSVIAVIAVGAWLDRALDSSFDRMIHAEGIMHFAPTPAAFDTA